MSVPTSEVDKNYRRTMVDIFTRFGVAAPMPDQTAQTVVDALLARWILLLRAPRRLLSDQGANFESAQVQNLCAL